jgi:2'-deoxymugineic-acid 2'-dioxygenase/mugineic-acid 3-dioxygenase
LIAEGLGFDNHDFFEGDLSGGETLMNVNYYPRCPDPSLTMGIRPHSDRHLLTILSQGEVSGLQAKHRGRWIRVQPIHNAFVINFGRLQMEVSHSHMASILQMCWPVYFRSKRAYSYIS